MPAYKRLKHSTIDIQAGFSKDKDATIDSAIYIYKEHTEIKN